MNIGEAIRRRRVIPFKKQYLFAEKVGVSNTMMSEYESGNRRITFVLLEKICKVLNCKVSELIKEAEEIE